MTPAVQPMSYTEANSQPRLYALSSYPQVEKYYSTRSNIVKSSLIPSCTHIVYLVRPRRLVVDIDIKLTYGQETVIEE